MHPDFVPSLHDVVMFRSNGELIPALVVSQPVEVDITTYDASELIATMSTRPTECRILVGEFEHKVDVTMLEAM